MSGIHVKFDVNPEDFLAHLTEAAYKVALKHGLSVPFIEVELEMQQALRAVVGKDMQASPACGATETCKQAVRHEPWSREAKSLFREE